MMEPSNVDKIEQQPNLIGQLRKPTTISYSQYKMWMECPMQWKLAYIDKLAKYEENINTAFGSAIHLVVQSMLTTLYTDKNVVAADTADYYSMFIAEFAKKAALISPPTSPEVIAEFEMDGKAIIDYLTTPSVRRKHFPANAYELVGIELPLEIKLLGGKVAYKGFLDVVLQDKLSGKIKIIDLKTATNGWNKYQLMDRKKLDQLVLYKRFYSKIFNVPLSSIDVEFIILKRKLLETVTYPQQRVQRFTPGTSKTDIKEVEETFLKFVNECFDSTGEKNASGLFAKTPGKAKKNCKYCQFKTMIGPDGNPYCDQK